MAGIYAAPRLKDELCGVGVTIPLDAVKFRVAEGIEMVKVPTYDQLINPTIQALKALGGSGTIEEIYNQVTELVDLTDDQRKQMHDPERSNQTEVEYRLAWSRTYLKKFGVLENPSRGIWGLTQKGRQLKEVDPDEVKRYVKDEWKQGPLPDDLTAEVIERALESKTGVEYEGDDPSDDGVGEIEPFDPTLIRIDTRSITVDLMMRRIENKEINLKPDFQRMGGIWDEVKQSRLIESILLRIPLPAFYIDASNDEEWLVIDGLQRLTALRRFILDKELRLKKLEFWQEYDGDIFDLLPRSLQRRIEETQLTLYLVQSGTPHKVKFNIFKRINTGGVPLSGQEIRHALNLGAATELLKELAESMEFKQATVGSVSPMRMTDRECVLRFLSFKVKSYSEYGSKDELDSFLNDRMQDINKMDSKAIERLRYSFLRAMNAATEILGEQAFRKIYLKSDRRLPISKALFEVWSVNFDKRSDGELAQLAKQRKRLIDKFVVLMGDTEFERSISSSTGSWKRVHYRFSRIDKIIQETLNA